MGWQETSVPFHQDSTELNRVFSTPNMARLAEQGVKFTQAYACAVCSPSRVSWMTGYNAARHQVTNWTLRRGVSPDWEHPVITPPEWNVNGISPNPDTENSFHVKGTLPQILSQAGYRTIHVGKAHFGAKGTPGENPENLGFQVNIAGHAAGGPGSYHGDKNFSAFWRNGSQIWDVPGLDQYHGQEINLTEALTREAIKEIKESVRADSAFFLYMSHYAIHAPWEEDRRFYQKYLDLGYDEFTARYASMVESMDHSLGDIMDVLTEENIEENTLVLFLSDNGSPSQARPNLPLRGHKLTPYEGGIRVPMLVKWPGRAPSGMTCGEFVIIEDVYPSLLQVAGVTLANFPEDIDGKSWVEQLQKPELSTSSERPIYWHFPHTYDQPPYSALRKGKWKLIYQHVDQSLELYNLESDISESQNMSKSKPEKLQEMVATLANFLRESKAGMSINKSTGQPIPYPDEL